MARTSLATIEAQLAEKAKDFNKTVQQPQGRRIQLDQKTGNFIAPGDVNLGTELKIIVVDFCSANRYYPGKYDPSNVVPPVCWAFGDVINEMEPEEAAPEKQSELCMKCPHNQWGSAGNGKACKNTRELAVVLADELDDPDYEPELFHISVAPSSIKHFDRAATEVYNLFNGPPIKAVITLKSKTVKNWVETDFVGIEANKHLERVFDLMEQAPALIARDPDMTNYKPSRTR